MELYTINENNAGGYYRLSLEDFYKLLTSGSWGLNKVSLHDFLNSGKVKTAEKILDFLRCHVCGYFENHKEAIKSFTEITGANFEDACLEEQCCGAAFTINDYYTDDGVVMFDANALQEFNRLSIA